MARSGTALIYSVNDHSVSTYESVGSSINLISYWKISSACEHCDHEHIYRYALRSQVAFHMCNKC
jgi:hypothetical protein